MDNNRQNQPEKVNEGPFPTVFLNVLGKRSWPATILGIGLLQAVLTRLNLPSWSCLFYKVTGYNCPGCGMSRSMASLLKADLTASWEFHPFGGFYVVGALLLTALACLPPRPRKTLLNGLRGIDTRFGFTLFIFSAQIIWGIGRLIRDLSATV